MVSGCLQRLVPEFSGCCSSPWETSVVRSRCSVDTRNDESKSEQGLYVKGHLVVTDNSKSSVLKRKHQSFYEDNQTQSVSLSLQVFKICGSVMVETSTSLSYLLGSGSMFADTCSKFTINAREGGGESESNKVQHLLPELPTLFFHFLN